MNYNKANIFLITHGRWFAPINPPITNDGYVHNFFDECLKITVRANITEFACDEMSIMQ